MIIVINITNIHLYIYPIKNYYIESKVLNLEFYVIAIQLSKIMNCVINIVSILTSPAFTNY